METIQSNFLYQGISLLLLFFIIPLQITIQRPLMDYSSALVESIQNVRTDTGVYLLSSIQYLEQSFAFIFVIPFVTNFLEPIRAHKVVLFFVFSIYLSNLLAIIFQESRPFWYTTDITGELCLEGYGNPSNGIVIYCVVLATISIESIHDKPFRWFVYAAVFTFAAFISFAFLYLGENFPHQVLTSWFISFILVTFSFTFDKFLVDMSYKSCYMYTKNRVFMVYWYLIVMFLIAFVMALDEFVLSFSIETPQTIDYAVQDCSKAYNPNGSYNVYSCACLFYGLSYIIGSSMTSKRLSVYWTRTSWWQSAIRYLISAGYSFGVFCLFGKDYIELVPSNDPITSTFFNKIFPQVFSALGIAFLLPFLFKKIKIVLEVPLNISKQDQKIISSKKLFTINE